MDLDNKKLSEILLRGNYLAEEDIRKAEDFVSKNNSSLFDYFINQNLLTKDLLGQAVAESYGVAYSDLNSNQPTKEQILKIPEGVAKKFRCVLFKIDEGEKSVTVATDNPGQADLLAECQKIFPNQKIVITYSLSEDINAVFVDYQKPLETRFSKIIEKKERIAPELLEEIFEDALIFKASDIHFEPQLKEIVIRFRVDGVLHEAGRIPKEFYENILNRVKVKSGLRIDEHFSAQDGSLRYESSSANASVDKKENKVVDMRTSIVPTVEGEKMVLRVLATYIQGFGLSDIGLSQNHQELLKTSAEKPFGMILVVGPTGSGKTTTLYSLLKLLNSPGDNITTIEDPVEYKVQGINQIQVNTQTNLTFAKGLRSIVRQDPDIILVGEIRDQETAEIAVNAALTGHLLLSTFHANDAATAIPRLIDMGVEPFLLASTLEVIIAQRLVRKICDNCRFSIIKNQSDFNTPQLKVCRPYFTEDTITLYEGKGCEACGHTGFKGRTAVFEFIVITPAMQELITQKPSSQKIWALASREGSKSLFEDGVEKVKNGVTTLEELLRVAEPPALYKQSPTNAW